MVMLSNILRINSCIYQSLRNSRQLPETSIQAFSLFHRNELLFTQVSPFPHNIIPFQHLPQAILFRPFSTSSTSLKPRGGDINSTNEKIFKQLEEAAYLLLYEHVEKDDATKLSALWMQATEGPYDTAKHHSWIERREFVYLENWKILGNMSKEEAAKKYIEVAQKYIRQQPKP